MDYMFQFKDKDVQIGLKHPTAYSLQKART